MKRLLLLSFFISFILLSSKGIAQTITSALAGPWNQTTTWNGGVIPTAANSTAITVQHNVNIPASFTATVDQVTVNFGNTLTIDATGVMDLQSSGGTDLTLQEDFIIFFIGSNLIVNGDFINRSVTALNLGAGLSTTTFGSGSRYEHAIDGGTIPNSSTTWDANSTCEITGVSTGVPGGLNQILGHLTWNNSAMTGNLPFTLTSTTINGNLSILNTNSPNVVTLAGSNGTVDINGDFIVSGNARFVGTSVSNVTLDVEGDFLFSSTGVLSLLIVQTGTLNFNVGGDFSVTSGTLQAYAVATTSNVTFDGSAGQTFNTSGGTLNNNFNWTIINGSTVNTGTSAFVNGGTFDLEAGGTLGVGSADGLVIGTTNGNVRVSGTRTYTANGNITYNGTAAQDLGDEWGSSGALNAVAVNLEIDNVNGVTNNIIGATSLVGDLTLTDGSFNIGNNNSLDVQGAFNVTGGTIGGLTSSSLTFSNSGVLGTLSMTSGSQNLGSLTNSRVATPIVLGSDLTVATTLSLTSNLDFSAQSLTFNGASFAGGAGIIGSSTSNLTLGGTGFSGTIPFAGSSQLNDLSLSSGSSTYTINSAVTINNNLNMNSGTLTHTSGLTMATNSTFVKDAGSIISNSPNAVTSYNVLYTGAGTASLELPTSATALNNLTVNVAGTVTLPGPTTTTTINGDLLLSSGTLAAAANNVTLTGSNWTANGGTFTIDAANTVAFSNVGTTTLGGTSIENDQFGNLTISSGTTLSAPNVNFNVNGTWNNQGTYTPNNGTVTFNGSGQNIDANGQPFNNVAIAAAGTKTLTSALDVNGDLTITSTLAAGTNSINVAGNWDSNTGTFTAANGIVTYDGAAQSITSGSNNFNDITLAGTGAKSLLDALDINGDLTISSTLDVGANESVNIVGNWTNNGTFNAGSGKVTFDGNGTSNVLGSATTVFNDIDVTGTTITEIETSHNLTGTLTLAGASSGFDADGSGGSGVFTLVSSDDDPATDGNIAAIPTGATYEGATTVQRYMSLEGRIWRYISTPVMGLDISDWQGEFPITGTPIGCLDDLGGLNLPSLYYYDETEDVLGGIDDGWIAHPTALCNETIDPGTGYSAFMRDSGQITISQRGEVNQGDFDYTAAANPLTYTSTGSASDDGWNLLGNPYPSAIDWDAMWNNEGTPNLDGTMYIRDNPSSVYATWNAATSSGTNGGSKNVAIAQSFWVHATASPALTLNENEKTTDSHEFFRITPPANYLRIALSDGANRDETLVHFFDDAIAGLDKYDAYKLQNDIFNLSTLMNDGTDMVINALKTMDCESNLNLNITNIDEGSYSLKFTELNSFTESIVLYLVDNFVGGNIKMVNDQIYDFAVTADEASYGSSRFTLLFSEPSINTELAVQGSDVCDSQNAVVSIEETELDVSYVLFFDGQQVSDAAIGNGGTLELVVTNLGSINGEYEIDVRGDGGCGSVLLTNKAVVTLEGIYSVDQVEGAQACASSSLTVTATGAPADGAYRWYDTEVSTSPLAETIVGEYTTPELINSTSYYVSIVNSLGCEGDRTVVEAVIINLEIPIIDIDTLEHGVYQLVSSYDQGNQWFMDGEAVAGATANTLVITEPGTYSVLVEQSGCTIISDEYDYADLVTGLSDELNDILISIAPNPFTTSFDLHIPIERFNLKKTEITIFDINGKIVYFNKKIKSEIISIALRDIKNGIYLINIYDGETGVQHKLVKE